MLRAALSAESLHDASELTASLDKAIRLLSEVLAGLDADRLTGTDACALTTTFALGERLCATGRALTAKRSADTGAWKTSGRRSAAEWLGQVTGTSSGQAAGALGTCRRLRDQPELNRSLRAGELSLPQAEKISAAGAADPSAVKSLVETARKGGLRELDDACREVSAAARPDDGPIPVSADPRCQVAAHLDRQGRCRLPARPGHS